MTRTLQLFYPLLTAEEEIEHSAISYVERYHPLVDPNSWPCPVTAEVSVYLAVIWAVAVTYSGLADMLQSVLI